KLLDNFPNRLLLCEPAPNQVSGGDFLPRRVSIQKMQRLGQCRLELDLAGTDGLARCSPKRRQEIGADPTIGDLYRPRTQRQAGKLVLGFRYRADAVEECLGLDAPNRPMCEVPHISLIRGIGLRRE